MTFFSKIKWILGILLVFLLILATNLMDRHNFVSVRDSVVSIYEDRLVAKGLIFNISTAIHEKEMAISAKDTAFFNNRNGAINTDLNIYVKQFEQTKLTRNETEIFQKLKINTEKLLAAETHFISSNFENKNALFTATSKVKENLYELSKIQLDEGKRQMSISRKAIDTIELFTQIEIYILIFLAIVIQAIIIYSPKKKEN